MVAVRDYRTLVAVNMSEKALDGHVRRLLRDLGLWEFAFHAPDGTGRYQAGLPDWIIHGPGGCLYRELKTQNGNLTPKQRDYIARIASNGIDVDVWRPSDLVSGRIAAELKAVAVLRSVTARR